MTYVRQVFKFCCKCSTKYNCLPSKYLEPIFFFRRESIWTATPNLSGDKSPNSVVPSVIKNTSNTNPIITSMSEITNNSSQHRKEIYANRMLQIRQIMSFAELENFINTHKFSGNEAVPIYYLIRKLTKLNSVSDDTQSFKNFLKSSAFLKLCESIEKNLHTYSLQELRIVANLLRKFNIPEDSSLFQKTMQLILDNFNKFSSLEVLNLFILSLGYSKKNNLINYVRLACLEFMVYCFDSKRSPNETIDSIIFFSNQKVVPSFIKIKLIQDALRSDLSVTTPKMLTELCWAITQSDISIEKTESLIKKLLTILQSKLDETWPESAIILLSKSYCLGCALKKFVYFNEIVDSIANIAIKNNYSLGKALIVAKSLCLIPHLHTSLLKYIVHKAFIAEELTNLNTFQTNVLITVLGTTNFNRFNISNWEYYRKKLLEMPQLNALSAQSNPILYCSLNLASLGIYDNDLLRNSISLVSNFQINETANKEDFRFRNWCCLLLNQCVSVLRPSFGEQKIVEHVLKTLSNDLQATVTSYAWLNVVQKTFGGEDYVLTNCTTSLFHALSYVVVLDENNRAVDVSRYKDMVSSNSTINIEKINLEYNLKMLIILEFPEWMRLYFRNADNLLGFGKLYIQVLEGMGYNVIHLRPKKLLELMDVEQVPYLVNVVEKKCGPVSGQVPLSKTQL